MASQRWSEITEDGFTYLQANEGNVPGPHFERMERCVECGLSFRVSEMVKYRGKYYGIPCDCYKDIESLARKRRRERRSLREGRAR
jgi:hypothetical protein